MRESGGVHDRRYTFAGFAKHRGIADVPYQHLDAVNLGDRVSVEAANMPARLSR
jgi:hypothetical protein